MRLGPIVRSCAPPCTFTPSPPPLVTWTSKLNVPVQPGPRITSARGLAAVPTTRTPLTGPLQVYGTPTTGPAGAGAETGAETTGAAGTGAAWRFPFATARFALAAFGRAALKSAVASVTRRPLKVPTRTPTPMRRTQDSSNTWRESLSLRQWRTMRVAPLSPFSRTTLSATHLLGE